MKLHLYFILPVVALLLDACSNGDRNAALSAQAQTSPAPTLPSTGMPSLPSPPTPQNSEEYYFEFLAKGCSTGKHKLSTKKEYCDALLNDPLNSNCAREMRLESYQSFCTGTQPAANPGALSPMTTARCIVNGMDLKDRTFLDNINPFNPQRRQSFRDMFWDGKSERSFDVFLSAVDTYGKVRFAVTPAQSQSAAKGQIQFFQQRGAYAFSAYSNLGTKLRMLVTNYETEKEVESVCITDKVFKRAKKDLSRIRCLSRLSGSNGHSQEEVLNWDTRTPLQKELFQGRYNQKVSVRLNPAQQGEEESIQIEAVEVGLDKTMKAEATLNEGLEIKYLNKNDRTEVSVVCEPASK